LGELPPHRPPEPGSAGLLVYVVIVTTLAMLVGDLHRFRGDPLTVGAWRMLVHGIVPLAAVALYETVRARRGVALGALAFVVPETFVSMRLAKMTGGIPHQDWLLLGLCATGLGLSVAAMAVAGVDRRRWSIGLGDLRWWGPRTALALAVMIPVLVLVVYLSPSLQNFYPTWKPARQSLGKLATAMVGVGCDFFGWEMLFRALLLQVVLRRGDAVTAICLQTIPFCILHYDKPTVELVASLFGGLISGWFCLRAQTFLPLWILHTAMMSTVGFVAFFL
jgi:hypothetical protein